MSEQIKVRCDNCGAELPEEKMGKDHNGRRICCANCLFHPRGCRCRFGEYGIAETYIDPDFPGENDPALDDDDDWDDEGWDDEIDDWDSDTADEWDDLDG